MRFTQTGLKGAWLVEPEPIADERGSFARTFCEHEFERQGLETGFVQHSVSHSRFKGTLRGMHFQQAPLGEVKLVSCLRGAVHDVIVDLRPYSPTYMEWAAYELSADNRRQLYIPKGFAHGFMALVDDVAVNYLISEFYEPSLARGLRYDDPVLAIDWPGEPTVISQRDLDWAYMAPDLV